MKTHQEADHEEIDRILLLIDELRSELAITKRRVRQLEVQVDRLERR